MAVDKRAKSKRSSKGLLSSKKHGKRKPFRSKKRHSWDKQFTRIGGVGLLCILVVQFLLLLFFNPEVGSKLVDLPAMLNSYHPPSSSAGSSYPPYYDPPYNPSSHKNHSSRKWSSHVYRLKQQRDTIVEQRTKLKYILAKNSDHTANYTPCEWPTQCRSIMLNTSSAITSHGSNTSDYVIFQNNLPFDRFACGKVVLGEGSTIELTMDEVRNCQERPRVFWKTPSSIADSQAMPPIRLVRGLMSQEKYEKAMTPFPNCSVPCYMCTGNIVVARVTKLSVEGTNWEFVFSMEGPLYIRKLFLDPNSYQSDNYYAVTSLQSDVPLPYFSWTEYNIQNPPVDFDKTIKGASFLAKNCHSLSGRETYVQALVNESILDVYSLSGCLHNADPPAGVNMANKTAILERYLFHLAFENQRYDDYITEKVWGALSSGTLPIYMGAPNIKDHLPPNSVVFADDFKSPSDLAKYLAKLSNDKQLYNSFHEWRQKPLDPQFLSKYNFTRVHSTCRACKWAYAKRYGLGWNHTQQEIISLPINRTTCRDKNGLIVRPFEEYWMSDDVGRVDVAIDSPSNNQTCTLDNTNRQIFIDGKSSLIRTVYDADGVTDLIVVNKKQANYTLQLKFPILGADGLKTIDKHKSILQDDTSRFTIVTKEEVQLQWSSQNATLAFKVAAATPGNPSVSLNIRIIVEAIDDFHEGADKRANYFGQTMTEDFLNPMDTIIVHEGSR